jgi:UDP-glucose 4-epimerase
MKKVLVTGGAGFIGSHTCVELIGAGYTPVIMDDLRNSAERILQGLQEITGVAPIIHRADCCDPDAMERVFTAEGPFLGAIHFAAYKSVNESVDRPLDYYENNIGSLITLLRVAARHDLHRIVFSSSCAVYGQATVLPVTEEAAAGKANSPYGYSKVVCEQLLRDAKGSDAALNVVLLRYFNPIGAHPSGLIGELPAGIPNNLVPYVVQTAAGERRSLTIYGNDYDTPDGTCQRDFIHVVDLAKAHVKALDLLAAGQLDACEVINLGTGRAVSVMEIVRTFKEVTGMDVPFTIGPRRAGDVASIHAETSKSARVLNWTCTYSLADALQDAWRWQQHLSTTPAVQPG